MKLFIIFLSTISVLFGCGIGFNNSPSINIVTDDNCNNMTNNKVCTIKVAFKNGSEQNPVLSWNLDPKTPAITIAKNHRDYNLNDQFFKSIFDCQIKINSTPVNSSESCIVSFTYKSQGGSGTNSQLNLNLNSAKSETISITGN